ncbi:hypothetical protein [Bosea sp. ASV33]|uniref:hypothetical protein n=1 Tax=Bosea sp. ASV33 TaxID=2795106 RepID=UPI0018EACB95|nr:hypothetical protein [Bosea sp. ASV33]
MTIDEIIAELRDMAIEAASDQPRAVMTEVDMMEWDAALLIEEMRDALSKIAQGCDDPREAARFVIDERERRLRRMAQASASSITGSG